MSEQGSNNQGSQTTAEELEPRDQTETESNSRPKKLSAAEKLDLWEHKKQLHLDKSQFHHKQAAHYAKKIGALRRMAAELGVEIV